MLEESLYNSLVEQSRAGCDPAITSLPAPLSFLRYASRRRKKVGGLEDRAQIQQVAAEPLSDYDQTLWHVCCLHGLR